METNNSDTRTEQPYRLMIQSEQYGNILKQRIKSLYDNIIGDFDSDSAFITNQKQIVESAKRAYEEFPTIVNNIPKSKKQYENTLRNFAIIDNGLTFSQNAIGQSSNLAQLAQTYMYSFNPNDYKDAVCILSVLA